MGKEKGWGDISIKEQFMLNIPWVVKEGWGGLVQEGQSREVRAELDFEEWPNYSSRGGGP